jgi:membrane fusion protein (multidrug efflux system)
VLIGTIVVTAGALAAWKRADIEAAEAAAASQPEPMEMITAAFAETRAHGETATSIGTVLALRSITLRNEEPGTVREVRLMPGQIVDAGAVLVALDVTVETAELEAQAAQAELARTMLVRLERLGEQRAASQEELDQARAEREVALAHMARTRAIIARKTIRAPFRARVGIADVHAGQYLNQGTQLTTLQGVADAAHVDFAVSQQVAAGLRVGDRVVVFAGPANALAASIVAIDARVDPTTRNALVRARLAGEAVPAPGASVRVVVPVGASSMKVVIPVSSLRKGPAGDHVFVLTRETAGEMRAHVRPVRTGPIVGDGVVILEGLEAGEQLAASGSFKLREGMKVVIASAAEAAAGEAR